VEDSKNSIEVVSLDLMVVGASLDLMVVAVVVAMKASLEAVASQNSMGEVLAAFDH
jgi:hypothetical protein